MTNNLTHCEDGLKLTQSFEACRLTAYQDSDGIWRIGWGSTAGVNPGMVITQAQADALCTTELEEQVGSQ